MVSEVYWSLITVIDLHKTTIAISWLYRTAIPIVTDLDNSAVVVVVNLPLRTAITVTTVALTRFLIVNFVLGSVMSNATKFSSGNDRPATSNSILLVNTELSDLLTDLIFAMGAILAQTLRLVCFHATHISALILLRPPVAITEMISVTRNPCVNAFRTRLVSWVKVRTLLIITVEGDFWRLRKLFALGVVLDNFPVLLN